jgi:hypothetical protein
MIDIIKTTFDITLKYPLGTRFSTEHNKTPFNSIGGGAPRPESVRMDIGLSFCHRFQCQQIECLHRSVMHDR